MSRFLIILTLFGLLLAGLSSQAQSLADVLSSIQERKQTVEQRKQVESHLQRTYTISQPDIPEQVLIEWEGLGTVQFPTGSDTAGLGIDARIKLLNQAVGELRDLQPHFLNIRKEDLTADAQIGALRPFMLEDFPAPGRVDAENYHLVLRLLAQSVRRLAVIEWPLAGHKQQTYVEAAEDVEAIGPGTLSGDGVWERLMIEDCNITSHTVNEGAVSKTERFYDSLALFSSVPQANNPINGKLAVIARNNWSHVPDASVSLTAPATWKKPQDGSYLVTLVQENPVGEYPTAGAPGITVALEWTEEGFSQPAFPYPAGGNIVDNSAYYGDNAWESLLLDSGYAASPNWDQPQYVMSRSIIGVFAPSFIHGLDATGKAAWLKKSEKASTSTPGDAIPALHPSHAMLMAIPLGTGLDGATIGYIGITPGESGGGLIQYSKQEFSPYHGGSTETIPSRAELATRFDYAASLRFIGPAQDFHVVYETSREEAKRGAVLPAEIPTGQQITDMGCRFFFRNWDLPRLKQVVSRDFIVNITPQGHYKNLVEIYRRPVAAGSVDRTPGVVADVDEGNLIRTLLLENPDAANDAYPDTPEKLHITDDNTVYKIWRTGYPEYASKTPSGVGVWHPDIHFEIKEGDAVRYSKSMEFQGVGHVVTTTSIDGVTVSTETINDQDWAWYLGMEPSNRTIVHGGRTTAVTNTFAPNPSPWPTSWNRYEWHPLTSNITSTSEPDLDLSWHASGRLASAVQGTWRTDYSIEGDALKAESKFDDNRYATVWTEWSGDDRSIKTYHAPDGSITARTDSGVDWAELTLGDSTGTGLPGLPHQLTRKDGSAAAWTWTVGGDDSGSLTLESDTHTQTTAWNNRGHIISSQTEFIANGTLTVLDHAVPPGQFTTWGAPTQWQDQQTNLASGIAYDGGLSRPASVTSPLGLTTAFSNYDIFNRPGQVTSNGITATHSYTALSASTTYSGTDVVSGSESSFSTNPEGTSVSSGLIWGGVSQTRDIQRGASATTITGSHGLLGASTATVRNDDGSLSAAESAALPFGGVSGDALSVVNGRFVSKSAVADVPGTFAETHSDAWGRIHKIVTPSAAGIGSTETNFTYSPPGAALKRVITTEQPGGRVHITESDANGTLTRTGIDVNENGSLGASDRYAESITEVIGGKVVTTLSVTTDGGLREVLQTEWTPASGVTVTHINGNEESITTTPDYGALSLTSSSSKGWTRSTGINALGLASSVSLSGAAHPSTSLTPTWRSDGSLASVSLQRDGDTHTADFHPDGTFASLTAPGQGNILDGHSISGGVETLTVNGTTTVTSLDGTQKSTGGPNAIGQDESLTAFGGTYTRTVTPATGAATQTFYNAATVPTAKTYADESGESYGYSGERLHSISLARGGALTLEYSDDGAKDLLAATWPELDSGPLTSPAITHGYSYNRSGDLSSLSDDSGTRSLSYQNGRHTGTSYTVGLLQGYAVLPQHDSLGRRTGTLLDRDGHTFHSTTRTPDGLSDRIAALNAGGITATPQRDGAGRISGYSWSDGSANAVTQTWTRGAGGRIEKAESDVPGAPAFDYLIDPLQPEASFDPYGRRLKAQTAGGEWTYTYGSGGQLASAAHPTLGSFSYAFDGIGRRTDQGAANTTDILNRTTAWSHDQQKTLTIQAHPDARVWFNGTEVTDFSGTHQVALTAPGTDGGWVPWETLAILEGAGDGAGDPPASPLASPDAKAEQSGAVWVPPAAETFTYDAAGNRQSSAQWDYGWNAKNQLARIRTKDHTTAPQAYDISFSYDAEGRRVKKHVVEYADGSPISEKTVTYVWDEWELLYERHQLPSGLTLLERSYLWGPDIADGRAGGAGGLLLIQETRGATTTEIIPLYDGTGHVVALTDIEKNLLAEYAYGPFGEKIIVSGRHAQQNPWRWGTKYLDHETGLYYFGHRYYDPITGQWLSREPLGESESINLYLFAGNDPINHVDVLGLSAQEIDEISQQLGAFALDDPAAYFELRRKLQDNDFRITQIRERMGLTNVGILLGSDGAIVLGQDNTYLIDFAPRNYASTPNAWNEAGFFGRMGLLFTDEIPALYRSSVRNSALGLEPAPWLTGPVLDSSYTALSFTTGGMGSFWIPTLRGDYETAQNDLKFGAFELAAAPLISFAARPVVRAGGRNVFRTVDNFANRGGRFFHSTSNAAVNPILKGGFRTDIPNPQAAFHNNRFGRGVYLSDSPAAALAERPGGVVLNVEAGLGRNLNILNQGPITDAVMGKAIGRGARKHGFDSITTQSVQPNGGVNTIIFNPSNARATGVYP